MRGAADHFLEEYFHADNFGHSPFKLAERQTVAVQIDSILQTSPGSYQVRWTETQRDLNGVITGPSAHWEVQLRTQIIPPSSTDKIVSNPLGLFVTDISWTEQRD
jgi:type IV secretory pathway TrbF-like protein